MRNRAKCKLCGDVIESLHQYDFKRCKCGEIMVDGGHLDYKRCGAGDWKNFVYLDDEDNEHPVRLSNQAAAPESKEEEKPHEESKVEGTHNRREELLSMLFDTIQNSENLPTHVRSSFVTYLDLDGALTLIYAILKESQG